MSYTCPDCGEAFAGKSWLRAHLKAAHPRPPEVLNVRDFGRDLPPGTTTIMRGSPFGNAFIVGVHGGRGECIDQFIAAKRQDPGFIALVKQRLKGRHLACACKPRPCHGDWLLRVANDDSYLPVEPDGQGGWRFVLTSSDHSFTTAADKNGREPC